MRISDWSSDVCSSDLLADIETERQSWARRADEAKTHLAELEERLAATAAEIETLAGIPVALAEKRAALSELIDAAEARRRAAADTLAQGRSEEHTSELQSLMRISYAVFCLKKKQQMRQLRKHHTSPIIHYVTPSRY